MHRLRRTVFGACRRSQLRRGQRQIRAAFRGPIGGRSQHRCQVAVLPESAGASGGAAEQDMKNNAADIT